MMARQSIAEKHRRHTREMKLAIRLGCTPLCRLRLALCAGGRAVGRWRPRGGSRTSSAQSNFFLSSSCFARAADSSTLAA